MQKNKKKIGRKDGDEEESEDEYFTSRPQPIDFVDIMWGVNFKVENHRKRLKYVEDMDTTTAAGIVLAVKQLQVEVAALK
jgi:hypothetical protein